MPVRLDLPLEIVGSPEAVIKTDDMKMFAKLIRMASVTASKIGSVSRTSAGEDIGTQVVTGIKESEKEGTKIPEEDPDPIPQGTPEPPWDGPEPPWDEGEFE